MSRTLLLLAVANFAAASAGMIIAGILQLIAKDLHWSAAQAGHLITYYALAFAIGAPLLGAAFAKVCRKQLVILGLGLVALGSLGSALSTEPAWLLASRVLVAAGAALTIPSVSAIAAYLFPNERPRALAFVLTGMTLAVVFGVPIGTFIAGAWGWNASLYGAAIVAALAGVAIKLFLPSGIVVPAVTLGAWVALLASPSTYPLLGVSLIYLAASFSVYSYIAPFLEEMLGIGAQGLSWLLFWFGVANVGANVILATLSERIGPRRLLIMSILGLSITLGLTAFTENRLWLIVLLFATWSISSAFFGTLQQARVVESAPASGAALLALNTSAVFAGQGIGTIIGGWVIAFAGIRALPLTGAAIAILGVLVVAVSRQTTESRAVDNAARE